LLEVASCLCCAARLVYSRNAAPHHAYVTSTIWLVPTCLPALILLDRYSELLRHSGEAPVAVRRCETVEEVLREADVSGFPSFSFSPITWGNGATT
jgi:hypothetical protein